MAYSGECVAPLQMFCTPSFIPLSKWPVPNFHVIHELQGLYTYIWSDMEGPLTLYSWNVELKEAAMCGVKVDIAGKDEAAMDVVLSCYFVSLNTCRDVFDSYKFDSNLCLWIQSRNLFWKFNSDLFTSPFYSHKNMWVKFKYFLFIFLMTNPRSMQLL